MSTSSDFTDHHPQALLDGALMPSIELLYESWTASALIASEKIGQREATMNGLLLVIDLS